MLDLVLGLLSIEFLELELDVSYTDSIGLTSEDWMSTDESFKGDSTQRTALKNGNIGEICGEGIETMEEIWVYCMS